MTNSQVVTHESWLVRCSPRAPGFSRSNQHASVRDNIRKLSTQELKEKKYFESYGMKQVALKVHDQQMIFLVH